MLVELLYGDDKGFHDVAYFKYVIGIRIGVISARHIVWTINDTDDTFGYIGIDINSELLECRNYGCVEC